MEFTWDESKNIKNYKKHGIWFEEAQTIWSDQFAIELYDNDHSDSEDRFIRVGKSTLRRTLIVVFCEPTEFSVRIISARLATKMEREQYEEGI